MSLAGNLRQSQFFRHNAVFFMGSTTVGVLNYLFYPVLGHMLPAAAYGEVQTLASLFTQSAIFLTILTYVTVHVTVNVSDQLERDLTLVTLERLALLLGIGLAVVAIAAAPVLRRFLQFQSVWPFVSLTVGLVVTIPVAFRMAFLRGRRQFLRASMTDGLGSAVKLVLSPVLVLFGWQSFGAVTGLTLSQFASLYAGHQWSRQAGLDRPAVALSRRRLATLKPHLRYAMAVLCVSLTVILFQTTGVIAIKHYFSPELAGQYAGIFAVASIVYFLTVPFTGVLMSSVSLQTAAAKNWRQLWGALGLTVGIGGLGVLGISLIPRLVTQLLLGGRYLGYVHLLPRLSLTMLILAAANTLLMFHISLKHYLFCLTAGLGLLLMLVLVLVLHSSVGAVINAILVAALGLLGIVALQTVIFFGREKGGVK